MPKKGSGSRKRSATVALATLTVFFPPRSLSDFVIHYRSTAFHVHKFVLSYQSSYFCNYIEDLTAGQRAYPRSECDEHPTTKHCIKLPDSVGKVEADVDDFQLFLCHFYFAEHYSCVPYHVAERRGHINMAYEPNDPPDISLSYPRITDFFDLDFTTSSSFRTGRAPEVYEAVLSLCHYFACFNVLSRAEDNMKHVARAALGEEIVWSDLWPCFLLALKYNMRVVKQACAPQLAKACLEHESGHRADWEAARQELDKDTLSSCCRAHTRSNLPPRCVL